MLMLIQSKNHLTKLTGINIFKNKNVNKQVALPLNNIILNIFSNFVPDEILLMIGNPMDDRVYKIKNSSKKLHLQSKCEQLQNDICPSS